MCGKTKSKEEVDQLKQDCDIVSLARDRHAHIQLLQVEHKWNISKVCEEYNTSLTTGMTSEGVANALLK